MKILLTILTTSFLFLTDATSLLRDYIDQTNGSKYYPQVIVSSTPQVNVTTSLTVSSTSSPKPSPIIPVINVMNHGAKGDGKTDDYIAIMKAINTAKNASTKTVFIPKGSYIITQQIILDNTFSNIHLKGEGANSIIIVKNNPEGTAIKISDFESKNDSDIRNIEISDLKIVGNKGEKNLVSGFGISTYMNTDAKIYDLKIRNVISSNFFINGIQLEDCVNAIVSNVESFENKVHGFGIRQGSYSLYSIKAHHNEQLGIDFSGTQDTIAEAYADNIYVAYNKGGGGKSADLWNLRIDNLTTENNLDFGFYKSGPTSKWKITNFKSKNNVGSGLYFGNAYGNDVLEIENLISINDNISKDPGGSVYLPDNARSIFIRKASISDANGRGLTVETPNVKIDELNIVDTKSASDFPMRIQGNGGGTFGTINITNGNYKELPYGLYVETNKDVTIEQLICKDTRIPKIMTKTFLLDSKNSGTVYINGKEVFAP